MAEVLMTGVTKTFDKTTVALDDVSMSVADGDFIVLLGPTGAGKTTTLRLISGLERPDAGDILINGRSVIDDTPAHARCGDGVPAILALSAYERAR